MAGIILCGFMVNHGFFVGEIKLCILTVSPCRPRPHDHRRSVVCRARPHNLYFCAHVAIETVEIDSCIRGHHVYKASWKPTLNEELNCYKEEGNPHDPYAVAVTKGDSKTVVGHVLHKISAACYLFLVRD